MERYFKKNMKFIVASLVFAVIALVAYFVMLANSNLDTEYLYDVYSYYFGDNQVIFLGSSLFLALMVIIDIVFIVRKKVMPRGLTLLFETLMIILMIFDVYYICGNASYGVDMITTFMSLAPILNIVISFYWIQSFSYSDSVVKSKKDNDICYYLVVGLVLILITYFCIDVVLTDIADCSSEVMPFVISFAAYIITTGIAYIFFAKAIENYQDELILTAESKKEVRVEAGKKAAKTRKENEDKTSTKKVAPKKSTAKKATTKKSK